jgi:DNA polymerase
MAYVFLDNGKELRNRCKECPLYENKFVLGRGIIDADVLIIGEAPGKTECAAGVVFVGRGGSLVNKELNRIGLWNYWITNVVKCCHFPKSFSPDLLQYCIPILLDEVKARKKVIALGKVARDAIGATEWGILNEKVATVPHPGYILRRPRERGMFKEQWTKIRDWIKEDTVLVKELEL